MMSSSHIVPQTAAIKMSKQLLEKSATTVVAGCSGYPKATLLCKCNINNKIASKIETMSFKPKIPDWSIPYSITVLSRDQFSMPHGQQTYRRIQICKEYKWRFLALTFYLWAKSECRRSLQCKKEQGSRKAVGCSGQRGQWYGKCWPTQLEVM